MIEKVPVFRELTDKESVSLSVKSTKLFTLAALYDANVELLKGREKQEIITNANFFVDRRPKRDPALSKATVYNPLENVSD